MRLDFSTAWSLICRRASEEDGGPAFFALEELSAVLRRMGAADPVIGDESRDENIVVLDCGNARRRGPGGRRSPPRFSWRASSGRVEVYGGDGAGLVAGVYDFLAALGARWPAPGGSGERLPTGPVFELARSSGASRDEACPTTLILGHGCYAERWRDEIEWAARAGYSSVFFHVTPESMALGAAPQSLYESLRGGIAAEAQRRGLVLEWGGHLLSSLLPRSLFARESELFREVEGQRRSDRNFCPTSEAALSRVGAAFSAMAAAHPEVSVFHIWPDDLPGGGWCSCTRCSGLSPSAQSLAAARALAAALAEARPDAALSLLAYHDTEDLASALASGAGLPPNLELLWAPRTRSWGHALGDARSSLNAASLSAFRRTAEAWRAAGGGRVAVFEYWEDALLFKGAAPPLPSAMAGDLAAYRGERPGEGADAVGILLTGGRAPLGPRPNAALLPAFAAAPREMAAAPETVAAELAAWSTAAYGPSSEPMLEYLRELEAAWAIDLDVEEGETGDYMPEDIARAASDPPADWGDPWKAGLDRLAAKRARCEELFDHLRAAEAALQRAQDTAREAQRPAAAAVEGEAAEYAISGSVLELNCARLAAYHELAAGDARAAGDVANLALSACAAVKKAAKRLPDPRGRRELAFLVSFYYELRLRAIRRANARSALRRLAELWSSTASLALAASRLRGAYARPIARRGRRH